MDEQNKVKRSTHFGLSMVIRGRAGGRGRCLSWASMVKVALMRSLRRSTLASALSVSAFTVRRLAVLIASAAFHLQAAQLGCMTRCLTDSVTDPGSNAGVELDFAVLTAM